MQDWVGKKHWSDDKPVDPSMPCPLCGTPLMFGQYDISHKELCCRKCDVIGDRIFEFALKVKERLTNDDKVMMNGERRNRN